jgi:hypothetical protein
MVTEIFTETSDNFRHSKLLIPENKILHRTTNTFMIENAFRNEINTFQNLIAKASNWSSTYFGSQVKKKKKYWKPGERG